MKFFKINLLFIHISTLICTGCTSNPPNLALTEKIASISVIGPDYRKQGKIPYDTIEGELESTTGYRVYYTHHNLTFPVYGLIAAPSVCNAKNNLMSPYTLAPQAFVIKVEDSSHCHFEFPIDRKCSIVCGKGEEQFSTEVIQQTIPGLTTAFLLWQTGIDADGETWWSDSQQNYKTLREAGYLTEP